MKSKSNNIYCIDTSAFVTMHRYYSMELFPALWDEMNSLFKDGHLISHDYVYDEVDHNPKNQDNLAKWIANHKKSFKAVTQRQLQLLPGILAKFPKLIDPEIKSNQADPYLIAMLQEIMEQYGLFGIDSSYIIVSMESETKANKIPSACKEYNIRHMNLTQFFSACGWRFELTKE